MNFREPEGQIERWIEKLQEFNFEIQHRAGKAHSNADALSRRPCEAKSCKYCKRLDERELLPAYVTTITCDMSKSQDAYICLRELRGWPRNGTRPPRNEMIASDPTVKAYWFMFSSLVLRDGVACRRYETVGRMHFHIPVPREMQNEIMFHMHDCPAGGHLGVDKT